MEDFYTENNIFFARCAHHGFDHEQSERVVKAILASELTWDWVLSYSVSDVMAFLDKDNA